MKIVVIVPLLFSVFVVSGCDNSGDIGKADMVCQFNNGESIVVLKDHATYNNITLPIDSMVHDFQYTWRAYEYVDGDITITFQVMPQRESILTRLNESWSAVIHNPAKYTGSLNSSNGKNLQISSCQTL